MKVLLLFIACAFCVSCHRQESTSRVDSVQTKEERVYPYDSARLASDTTRMKQEIPWQCRSELLGHSDEHSIAQGYVGEFRRQKLYYEVWDIYGPAGTSSSYILLLTDTVWNDTFDICMPQTGEGEQPDSALVERMDSTDSYRPTNLSVRDVPGMFQVLRYGDYGYQNYSELNHDKEQRVYIKGNSLYFQHWDSPRYDDAVLELERYDYSEQQHEFVYRSKKVLRREPWE